MHHLELVNEVWNVMTSYIDENDQRDVAYDLVTLLVDMNFEPIDIREFMSSDPNIVKALKEYDKDTHDEEEYEELDFDNEDREWD